MVFSPPCAKPFAWGEYITQAGSSLRSKRAVVSSSSFTRVGSVPLGYTSSSAWTRAIAKYNGAMGYLISAAEGQRSVNLTDPQWQALIYVASKHGFSAPHLRLEAEDETLEVDESDAEGLRVTLGKAIEARDIEEIRIPG